MKYFVANDFRPSADPTQPYIKDNDKKSKKIQLEKHKQLPRRTKKTGAPLPKYGETVFLKDHNFGRISLFVYGKNDALILIVAPSQRKAYDLVNVFRAVMTCFFLKGPFDGDKLLEIGKRPTPDMSLKNLAKIISYNNLSHVEITELSLRRGIHFDHEVLERTCEITARALPCPLILNALLHLEYSYSLMCGLMSGSFYLCHYSRDRQVIKRYQLERDYLENRFKYDSAFVSAFRGIECVLDAPHFKRNQIADLLKKADLNYKTSFTSSQYRSLHEIFSTKQKWWEYKDIIAYYLKLRNSVSAHGNPSPIDIVMEDQVYEIQLLLRSMIDNILMQKSKSK